jgi:hypothetical protein
MIDPTQIEESSTDENYDELYSLVLYKLAYLV